MAFTAPKETYSGKVYNVNIGTGDRAASFGGKMCSLFCLLKGQSRINL